MKLIFTKNEELKISLALSVDGELEGFDYIRLIQLLSEDNDLEKTEFKGDFTPQEKTRIEEMITEIHKRIDEKDESDEENEMGEEVEEDIQSFSNSQNSNEILPEDLPF